MSKFQGGLTNSELAAEFAKKLPGVTPTERELSAFALGIKVGEALPREAKQGGHGIYVASRVSQAPMWRGLRDNGNVPIVSTWIDEAGDGETADFGELWTRIQREIAGSSGLVFWADVNDAPWKGALIEIGIALALGKPVGVVLLGELEGRTMRPVGSWIHHPNVRVTRFLDEAIDHASACRYVGHEGQKP